MVRHVRSAEGSRFYGLPIGAPITLDDIEAAKRRHGRGAPAGATRQTTSPTRSKRINDLRVQADVKRRAAIVPPEPKVFTPVIAEPTIKGDHTFKVGGTEFSVPAGSRVFPSPNDEDIAYVVDPVGELHVFTPEGEAVLDDTARQRVKGLLADEAPRLSEDKPKSRFGGPPMTPEQKAEAEKKQADARAKVDADRRERQAKEDERLSKSGGTGVFNEYDPSKRTPAESTSLTDLGFDPEEDIEVFRGVPTGVSRINEGDWVTADERLARDYAGGGSVVSLKVKAKDLRADPSVGSERDDVLNEMIYRPDTSPAKPKKTETSKAEAAKPRTQELPAQRDARHAPKEGLAKREPSPDYVRDETSIGDTIKPKPSAFSGMRRSGLTGQHITEDGDFTPERKALHDEIIARFLDGVEPVDNPVQYMNGGGPASGKGTMTKGDNAKITGYPPTHTVDDNGNFVPNENPRGVIIDPDQLKLSLPEAQRAVAAKAAGETIDGDHTEWAANLHMESSHLAKRLHQAALDRGVNLILDGVNNGSAEEVRTKVARAKDAGYTVEANYIFVEPESAMSRARSRAERSGRWVPEEVILEAYANLPEIFDDVKTGVFDKIRLFDNNTDGAPGALIFDGGGDRFEGLTPEADAIYQRYLDSGTRAKDAMESIFEDASYSPLSGEPRPQYDALAAEDLTSIARATREAREAASRPREDSRIEEPRPLDARESQNALFPNVSTDYEARDAKQAEALDRIADSIQVTPETAQSAWDARRAIEGGEGMSRDEALDALTDTPDGATYYHQQGSVFPGKGVGKPNSMVFIPAGTSREDAAKMLDEHTIKSTVHGLSDGWKGSSTNAAGKAITEALDRKFAGGEGDRTFADDFVDAQYAQTQAFLAEQGISSISAYRGLKETDEGNVRDDLGASSWTTDRGQAEFFSGREGGTVVERQIPAADIFAIGGQGSGSEKEREVIARPKPAESKSLDELEKNPVDLTAEAAAMNSTAIQQNEDGTISLITKRASIMDGTPAETEPLQYIYRAISDEEYAQIKERGFMQSDGRMNLEDSEGTVATHRDPSFYLPNGIGKKGRLVRIKYDPADGWWVDPADSYLKNPGQIPVDRIDAVGPEHTGYGTGSHSDPQSEDFQSSVASGLMNTLSNELSSARSGVGRTIDPKDGPAINALYNRAFDEGRALRTDPSGLGKYVEDMQSDLDKIPDFPQKAAIQEALDGVRSLNAPQASKGENTATIADALSSGDWAPVEAKVRSALEGKTFGNGYNVVIDDFSADAKGAEFEGSIAKDGRLVGSFRRALEGDAVFNLDITVDDTERGQGFGTAFSAASEDLYRSLGATKIRLNAEADGSYAWAKAGYEWDTESSLDETRRQGMASHLKSKMSRLKYKNGSIIQGENPDFTPEMESRIQGIIDNLWADNAEPPDMKAIADWTEPGFPRLGRDLLTGAPWPGVKRLDETDSADTTSTPSTRIENAPGIGTFTGTDSAVADIGQKKQAARFAEKFGEKIGRTGPEVEEATSEALSEIVAESSIRVIAPFTVAKFVAEGKSRYSARTDRVESATHAGSEVRRDTETDFFAIPTDTPDAKRPVYGYLHHPESNPIKERASGYGDAIIELKPEAKSRSSFVNGDSANMSPTQFPTMMSEHGPEAVAFTNLRDGQVKADLDKGLSLKDAMKNEILRDASLGYMEVQIHGGGFGADDIEAVRGWDGEHFDSLTNAGSRGQDVREQQARELAAR